MKPWRISWLYWLAAVAITALLMYAAWMIR